MGTHRWITVVRIPGTDDMWRSVQPAQGRHTHETEAAAREMLGAMLENNRPSLWAEVFGTGHPEDFGVVRVLCYEGHHDPVRDRFAETEVLRWVDPPANVPVMPRDMTPRQWGAWLRDRGVMMDPYTQRPMIEALAEWIEGLEK